MRALPCLVIVLGLSAVTAFTAPERLTCTDGVLREGGPGVVCDFDRACDGTCSFALDCPLCVYGKRGCKVACSTCPRFVGIRVPVGHVRRVRVRGVGTKFIARCLPAPAGSACPRETTTTTLPRECSDDADCLRFPEPCRTCSLGRCLSPATPGHAPVVCIPLVTTTTTPPAVCRSDADCELPGASVRGCVTVGSCGYCVNP